MNLDTYAIDMNEFESLAVEKEVKCDKGTWENLATHF